MKNSRLVVLTNTKNDTMTAQIFEKDVCIAEFEADSSAITKQDVEELRTAHYEPMKSM